jgi:hypothetical protein
MMIGQPPRRTAMSFKIIPLAVGLAVVSALAVAGATPAHAVTSCSSTLQKQVRDWAPDNYRAGASCSAIDANKRVRAKLTVGGSSDLYSSWFTARNTWYFTAWTAAGYSYSAGYEVGSV